MARSTAGLLQKVSVLVTQHPRILPAITWQLIHLHAPYVWQHLSCLLPRFRVYFQEVNITDVKHKDIHRTDWGIVSSRARVVIERHSILDYYTYCGVLCRARMVTTRSMTCHSALRITAKLRPRATTPSPAPGCRSTRMVPATTHEGERRGRRFTSLLCTTTATVSAPYPTSVFPSAMVCAGPLTANNSVPAPPFARFCLQPQLA